MITALLLAAAAPSAVDAEYSFARDAQRIGQWTAFRKWAERDAVIFTPQAAWAHQVLPQKDPPKAISWRPAGPATSVATCRTAAPRPARPPPTDR